MPKLIYFSAAVLFTVVFICGLIIANVEIYKGAKLLERPDGTTSWGGPR